MGGVAQLTPEFPESDRLGFHCLGAGMVLGYRGHHHPFPLGAPTYYSLDSVCGSEAAGLWEGSKRWDKEGRKGVSRAWLG